MARKTNYEKVVKIDGFDFKVLKGACKLLNDSGALESNIGVVGVSKEKLTERFMDAIDSVPEGSDEEKKIPEVAIKLFNQYVDADADKIHGIDITESDLPNGTIPKKKDKKKDKKKEGEKKEQPPKEKKMTREETIAPVMLSMKDGGTVDEIATAANKLYIEKRGEKADCMAQSTVYTTRGISLLEGLGLIEREGDIVKLKKFSV